MIFAKIMKDKNRATRLFKKFLHKYRLVLMSKDSYEEKMSTNISRFNVVGVFFVLFLFCFGISVLLITKTGLGSLIKNEDQIAQEELIAVNNKADSLIEVLSSQKKYLNNIKTIINGGKLINTETVDTIGVSKNISFKKSFEDSLLRIAVESETSSSIITKTAETDRPVVFYKPVDGVITDFFDSKQKHFGVDLVAKENARVSSVLNGTVVLSSWTYETGHVIGIQHDNGYFSLYKHNSVILRSVGDFVSAGEHIAIVGDSGNLSSGPHLHFELWQHGMPVNPVNYILF